LKSSWATMFGSSLPQMTLRAHWLVSWDCCLGQATTFSPRPFGLGNFPRYHPNKPSTLYIRYVPCMHVHTYMCTSIHFFIHIYIACASLPGWHFANRLVHLWIWCTKYVSTVRHYMAYRNLRGTEINENNLLPLLGLGRRVGLLARGCSHLSWA